MTNSKYVQIVFALTYKQLMSLYNDQHLHYLHYVEYYCLYRTHIVGDVNGIISQGMSNILGSSNTR